MPKPVIDAMLGHLHLEADIGGYEAQYTQAAKLASVYDHVAALIGAERDEIALVENATVAWQMAFYSLNFRAGDRIITSRAEYAANYVAFLQVARKTGARIDLIPDDESGAVDPDALSMMLDSKVRLVAISWIPSNGGLINPAEQIGRVTRAHGVPFLLDACQAVGQLPVDVASLGCDMLSATGRKFLRGPRGTGFLYVKRDMIERLEPPMIDHFGAPWISADRYQLRPDARRFETWENNYAARLGLGAAAEYASMIGLRQIADRASTLANQLRALLEKVPQVALRDLGVSKSAIVSFTIDGRDAIEINKGLFDRGFNVSNSRPEITLLDSINRKLPTLLRASPHYFNTTDEIEIFVDTLRDLIRPRRTSSRIDT